MKNKDDKKRIILKDNVLVKTKYELTLAENRLYNLLLYKFQKHGDDLKCVITQNEIKEVVKKKEFTTINGITTFLKKLSSKQILIEEKKENGKNSLWHNYKLIDGFTYDDEYHTFEIKATARIYDLLKKKFDSGCFTPTNLNLLLSLNNYYAQRLYDLLRLWSGSKNVINYSVKEIKEYLILDKKYDDYNTFKRRVIIPAVKELNETNFFEIDIKENKVGRKVDSIDFIIKDLDDRIYLENYKTVNKGTQIINKNETVENTTLFDTYIQSNRVIDIPEAKYKVIETTSNRVNTKLNTSSRGDGNKNYYIPNKKLFTTKTLNSFINDFKDYDFSESKNKSIFYECIAMTLDKDDEDKIKVKTYNYFKTVLLDKLNKATVSKKTNNRFNNSCSNSALNKYNEDELEQLLLENQKNKGLI